MQKEYDCWMKWNDRLRQAFDAAIHRDEINQTQLARACGVASSSVNNWFNGETKNIEARYLLPACRFLKVSPFWVMLGEDEGYDFGKISASEQIGALELMRLITDFTMSADEGRSKILMAATETQKLFPRQ